MGSKKNIKRRNVLKTIGSGVVVTSGVSTTAVANDVPYPNLSSEDRKRLREQFRDDAKAKTVLRELTAPVTEYLVSESYIDTTTVDIADVVYGRSSHFDDFENLYVVVAWNDQLERGEILLQTRIDAGDRQIKLTANATAGIGSASVHDSDGIIDQVKTTSSGDVTTESTCEWDGCVNLDDYCDYCCGNWLEPINYRIHYACTDSDGNITDTTCYCYFDDLYCCYECDSSNLVKKCDYCC